MYKIHYLPLALEDLKSIVRYISHDLEAPQTAKKLLSKIDREAKKTAANPLRCPVYISAGKLKYEYRVLHINSYSIFYAIENEKIEIHRILHARRNIQQVLTEKI